MTTFNTTKCVVYFALSLRIDNVISVCPCVVLKILGKPVEIEFYGRFSTYVYIILNVTVIKISKVSYTMIFNQ